MKAQIIDKHLLEMMWERFPEIMKRGTEQPAQQQEPVAWMHWLHGPIRLFLNKDEAQMELERLNRIYPVDAGSRKMRPLVFGDTSPQPSKPLTDEQVPKPEWANTQSDWVVMYLRKNSIFDADQIGAMLDFAAAASAAAHGITGEQK